ncbi:hypothetical protein EYF80_020594 [Liparis tanakae]|uniref:Uncharacterized protein n=1 Tax=Liparis tanakae TaxID=230148 RepID=A0A4Z2HTX5_9TELE|nr:hypothetical protein EYF80_020594 [Liparis tanakae]
MDARTERVTNTRLTPRELIVIAGVIEDIRSRRQERYTEKGGVSNFTVRRGLFHYAATKAAGKESGGDGDRVSPPLSEEALNRSNQAHPAMKNSHQALLCSSIPI